MYVWILMGLDLCGCEGVGFAGKSQVCRSHTQQAFGGIVAVKPFFSVLWAPFI